MDISHWDAAIHYDVQLAQYCDQTRSCNAILRSFTLCTPLPYNSGAPKYLCGLMSLWGSRKWTSAIWDAAILYAVQLAQYCDQTRSFNATLQRSPPVYSLALRLRNTKVPV